MWYTMGIDIGSTTAKVVLLDGQSEIVFSTYRRHKAEILSTLQAMLREIVEVLPASPGDIRIRPLVTGSAGMGISERFGIPFIQEVVASAEVVKQLYPQVRTLIDIGGEDAKMIFFPSAGFPDMRMNGSCAGGTGAFIDEMAALLNIPVTEISSLAEKHTTLHPIASRCGVFAKTDIQNLISLKVSREDIAASVLHAVVHQIMGTLARGCEIEPAILFCGGPLTFIPALRRAFLDELGLSQADTLTIPHPELLPATGAALTQGKTLEDPTGSEYSLQEIIDRLAQNAGAPMEAERRLRPLFDDERQRQQWEQSRSQHRIDFVDLGKLAGQDCFLGVDSGSTTSKIVLIDEQGRVAFKYYTNNRGNAIQAVKEGLQALQAGLAACSHPPRIARSVVTGYGEDLMRSAFGFDEGMVETLAHFRAARAFDPQVSFILDIGGQDMKAIFVQDGYIRNIEINEACSSGCGSFIETFANSMGYGVSDFAGLACQSQAPCDLGSRCTVFMNSRVKQALREAASVGDISAGLAYSVIKNALHKVLKIADMSVLGEHIVVQGGTFRNPAVHKALEQLTGKTIVCPDLAEMMGAYGAALTARSAWRQGDAYQQNGKQPGWNIATESLEAVGDFDSRLIRCRGCENQCAVTKLTFANHNVFYTGNRCERIYTNRGKRAPKGASLHEQKLRLLFERPAEPQGTPRLTIGIPRALNMYENYPFWSTLLVECGFKVQLSDPSSNAMFKKGIPSVMSENICFPAKLVHGHILNLIEKGVERIFYPMVFYEKDEFSDAANSFNCPIVSGYPDVVRSAIDPQGRQGIPLDQPSVTFRDARLLEKSCFNYLKSLGVNRWQFKRAFQHALQAQSEYKKTVRKLGAQILWQARQEGRLVILLLGHPYHLDPLINHGVPGMLTDFGVDVISEDGIPLDTDAFLGNSQHVLTQWEYLNRFYYAARWAGEQDHLEVVQLNSFACGPDAYTVDEVKSILRSHGKSYTLVRIDEIESTGSTRLRLRSLIETLKENERPERSFTPRKTVKLYEAKDRHKTILAPYFSEFCAPVVAGPLIDMDYQIETLPPPDRESVEIGLRYTPNEICYPGIIVIGDLIKALKSGKYDPAQVAAGSWQTGGQCRASSILPLLKRALVSAGLEQVPIVALTTDRKLHPQPGFDLKLREYIYKALMAAVYSDSISAMYHALAPREEEKGEAHILAKRLMAPLLDGSLPMEREPMISRLKQAVAAFNAIPAKVRQLPQVGIVGEIYVKFNAFSNNRVVEWLTQQNVEVIVPQLLEFFTGWLVAINTNVRENLAHRDLAWLLAKVLDRYAAGFLEEIEQIRREFKLYHPGHTIHDIARKASEVVSLTHQYGEHWLIAGEIGELAQQGINNVLCLQPFGCIANQVTAKGVEKRLKARYPDLNLLFLDLDAGVSEVNYFNRMYFFVNHALAANGSDEAQAG